MTRTCEKCIHYGVCVVNSYCHAPCGYYEEQRPHGEWIQDDELCFDPEHPWWYCSNCSERTGIRTKYCPECGAENKSVGDN